MTKPPPMRSSRRPRQRNRPPAHPVRTRPTADHPVEHRAFQLSSEHFDNHLRHPFCSGSLESPQHRDEPFPRTNRLAASMARSARVISRSSLCRVKDHGQKTAEVVWNSRASGMAGCGRNGLIEPGFGFGRKRSFQSKPGDEETDSRPQRESRRGGSMRNIREPSTAGPPQPKFVQQILNTIRQPGCRERGAGATIALAASAAFLGGLLPPAPAGAIEFGDANFQGSLGTTISHGVTYRVEGATTRWPARPTATTAISTTTGASSAAPRSSPPIWTSAPGTSARSSGPPDSSTSRTRTESESVPGSARKRRSWWGRISSCSTPM